MDIFPNNNKLMSIIKTVKCLKCASFIHDTDKCTTWVNKPFCYTDSKYKELCDCIRCKKRCVFCNDTNKYGCSYCHDGRRCIECNEFLKLDSLFTHNCKWDHSKPFCKFCNLPIQKTNGTCTHYHSESKIFCVDCNMPIKFTHKYAHDGSKCSKCDSLLYIGKCIYNCVDGGNFCIYCGYEGVTHNICGFCKMDNSGRMTKKAL